MSEKNRNILEYIICCIGAFATTYNLLNSKAYLYLKQYGGIDFLFKFYDAEHLLSIDDAVNDIAVICQRNGGIMA